MPDDRRESQIQLAMSEFGISRERAERLQDESDDNLRTARELGKMFGSIFAGFAR